MYFAHRKDDNLFDLQHLFVYGIYCIISLLLIVFWLLSCCYGCKNKHKEYVKVLKDARKRLRKDFNLKRMIWTQNRFKHDIRKL